MTSALFQGALSAHQAGRLVEAQNGYLQVLLKDERHADALHLLGVVHLQKGSFVEAEKLIRKALAITENAFFLGNLGILLKESKRLPEAETAYRRALEIKPDFADAHNNLGILLNQRNCLLEAEAAYRHALEIKPDYAEAYNNLGNLLKESKRLPEAESAYRSALEVKRDYAEAHNNLGILLGESKRLPEAEAAYRRAQEIRPDYAEAHCNLGDLLRGSKRLLEAEMVYRRVLEIKPDFAKVHNNLADLLKESKRLPEAEAAYRRALEIRPEYAKAHNNLGILLKESKRLPEAEAAYRCSLGINPDFAEAHNNLGLLLKESKRLPEAEAAYRRALEIKPDFAEAHNNLGNLLNESKRMPEAEAAYRHALKFKPDYAEAHNNLGILLNESKRLAEAEAAYRRALEIKPDYADARVNLGMRLLSVERYPEAWPLYESRYAPKREDVHAKVPDLSYPQWQGESLDGKSLVIVPEQGFGDYIQFVRYVPLLKARGVAHLTLVCAPPLAPLLETIEGVDAVATDLAQVPTHNYWSFVLSLPLHCATTADTIPVKPMPYVRALPTRAAQWHDRLPAARRKVGLVWKGNSAHKNDSNRSLPDLACLAPLWSVSNVAFISLQKGQGEDEASRPPMGQPIVALGARMEDFADSAAIVSQLDLVICVDTAIAHLAGAMGKPCWVLLPSIGTDWRWLLDRTDSPWYPSVRLFRQSDLKDWGETVKEVACALETWASVQYGDTCDHRGAV